MSKINLGTLHRVSCVDSIEHCLGRSEGSFLPELDQFVRGMGDDEQAIRQAVDAYSTMSTAFANTSSAVCMFGPA